MHVQCMHAIAVAKEWSCTIPKAKSSETALHSCWAGKMRCRKLRGRACGVERSCSSCEPCLSGLTSILLTMLWHVSEPVHGRVFAYKLMRVCIHNHCRGQASKRSAQFLISRSVALCLQFHTPSRSYRSKGADKLSQSWRCSSCLAACCRARL